VWLRLSRTPSAPQSGSSLDSRNHMQTMPGGRQSGGLPLCGPPYPTELADLSCRESR